MSYSVLRTLNKSAYHFRPQSTSSSEEANQIARNVIKRLRLGISKDDSEWFLREIPLLHSLTKVSDIIKTLAQCFSKLFAKIDVFAAVSVLSAFHRVFLNSFTLPLQKLLLSLVDPSPKEEESQTFESSVLAAKQDKERVAKQSLYIQLIVSSFKAGLFLVYDSENIHSYPQFILDVCESKPGHITGPNLVIAAVDVVTNYEPRYGANVPVILEFLAEYGKDISSEFGEFEYDFRAALRQIFYSKLELFSKYALRLHLQICLFERRLLAATHGFKSLEHSLKVRKELLDDYTNLINRIADVLGENHIEYPKSYGAGETNVSPIGVVIWDTDEEREFYNVLPTIDTTTDEAREVLGEDMTQFLDVLSLAQTSDDIDRLSQEFWCQGLNNKASRNRLVRFFLESGEGSQTRLYARFLASSKAAFSEAIEGLIQKLDAAFEYLALHKSSDPGVPDAINKTFFYTELVRFGMVSPEVAAEKARLLANHVGGKNSCLDAVTFFFDHCGRLLYYASTDEAHTIIDESLELLKRKKADMRLDLHEKMAIDGILLNMYPTEGQQLESKETSSSPEQAFIKHIIEEELEEKTLASVSNLVLKLDYTKWENMKFIQGVFSRPMDVGFDRLEYLASLLQNLKDSGNFDSLYTFILDGLCEDIERGLEVNEFKYNRARMTALRYLGFILQKRLLKDGHFIKKHESTIKLFFKTLFKLIGHGYPPVGPGLPRLPPLKGYSNPVDTEDDYFRVGLVVALLDTMNSTSFFKSLKEFERFEKKEKGPFAYNIDKVDKKTKDLYKEYLTRLQGALLMVNYYILTKQQPIPKDVGINVSLFFAQLRQENFYTYRTDLEDVVKDLGSYFQELSKGNFQVTESDANEDLESDLEEQGITEEEKIERQKAFDKNVEQMYKLMMQKSYEAGKNKQSRNMMRIDRPSLKQVHNNKLTNAEMAKIMDLTGEGQKMKFSLITRGSLEGVKSLNIPTENPIVTEKIERMKKEAEEKERLKRIVLATQYED